jgi:hypothetical protein
MSETKHTPGPWHMGAGNGVGRIFADDGRMRMGDGGTTLYPIATVCTGWDEAEDDANARLIAAAPAMLAALRDVHENRLLSCCCGESPCNGTCTATRVAKAIAAAEGA